MQRSRDKVIAKPVNEFATAERSWSLFWVSLLDEQRESSRGKSKDRPIAPCEGRLTRVSRGYSLRLSALKNYNVTAASISHAHFSGADWSSTLLISTVFSTAKTRLLRIHSSAGVMQSVILAEPQVLNPAGELVSCRPGAEQGGQAPRENTGRNPITFDLNVTTSSCSEQ
jgi:hypothetical protein